MNNSRKIRTLYAGFRFKKPCDLSLARSGIQNTDFAAETRETQGGVDE